jgi:virginiamycin A acetyltransferase
MPRPIAVPTTLHPVILPDGAPHTGTVFLAPAVKHRANFVVGDYTYASAHIPPPDWAFHLAPYLYDFSPETLTIGRFCQVADGVTFITSSANHRHDGFSSFPFLIFTGGGPEAPSMPDKGADTAVGHDVWIGQGACIMPGSIIGNGVIVGAGAVVTGNIPDYSIVVGNPAHVIRKRFDDATIAALLKIAWWHWPIEVITAQEAAIIGGDIEALKAAAP